MLNLLLSNAISFTLLTYLGNNLLETKEIRKFKQNQVCFIFIIILTLLNGENVNLYNTLNLTIGYLIYILYIYTSKLSKKLIVLLSFIVSNALGEVLSASLSNLFFELNSASDITSIYYTLAILLSGIITYFFLMLYTKVIKFSYWGELPRYAYIITVLPITTMLFMMNIQDYFYLLRNHEILVIILFGLLISNFAFVFVFLKTVSTLKLKNELEIAKLENKNIDFKYELLNAQYKANYSFMHDTIRSIMKMQSLLDKGDIAQFKNELLNLNKDMIRGLNIVNSNSSIISPIINFRLKEMLKNKIDFKSVIEYTDFSFLDIYEQRYIFDTLLEIGMLQCKTSDEKSNLMILKTKQLYHQVIIQLLTTHSNVEQSDDFNLLYEKLSEIVIKHNGKISFENINQNDSDSLIIMFTTNQKDSNNLK